MCANAHLIAFAHLGAIKSAFLHLAFADLAAIKSAFAHLGAI